jgi:hypothetical protein
MLKKPDGLARAALDLLKLADLTEPRAALELSAAIGGIADSKSKRAALHSITRDLMVH